MYKVKNITDHNIEFVDTMGKVTVIEPGKEIDNKYPALYGYDQKLVIEEIDIKKPNEEVKKNGNAR